MRELEAARVVKVVFVPTAQNSADLLTKSLPLDAFERHRVVVMGEIPASAGAEGGVERGRSEPPGVTERTRDA